MFRRPHRRGGIEHDHMSEHQVAQQRQRLVKKLKALGVKGMLEEV